MCFFRRIVFCMTLIVHISPNADAIQQCMDGHEYIKYRERLDLFVRGDEKMVTEYVLECVKCEVDHFRVKNSINEKCVKCPSKSTTNGKIGSNKCYCDGGYYDFFSTVHEHKDGPCQICKSGKYSLHPNKDNTCQNCAIGKYSGFGSKVCLDCVGNTYSGRQSDSCFDCSNSNETICMCNPTYRIENPSSCKSCEKDEYFSNDYSFCEKCPDNSFCQEWSDKKEDCVCADGYEKMNEGKCVIKHTRDNIGINALNISIAVFVLLFLCCCCHKRIRTSLKGQDM